MPEITQADWDRLAAAYGQAQASLIPYQRALAEREAEVAELTAQLDFALSQVHAQSTPVETES